MVMEYVYTVNQLKKRMIKWNMVDDTIKDK